MGSAVASVVSPSAGERVLVCACQVDELADGVKAALVVHHQTILRNKRCAVAYLQSRLETRGAGAASLGTRLSFFKNPLSQTPLCFSGGGVTWELASGERWAARSFLHPRTTHIRGNV